MTAKRLRATNEGKVQIGNMDLNCAVLEDGTRIITYSAVFEAFGRTKRGAQKDDSRVHTMPAFLNAKNLQSFVDEELLALLMQIEYTDINGSVRTGYNALILPRLCKVYLDARAAGINPVTGKPYLARQQEPLARASEILLLGLSNVGIIALVDEATGYQYDREKDELQKILALYVSPDILQWQLTFRNNFYQEIFRLRKWNFTPGGISKRPGVVGIYTIKYIYNMLPPNVYKTIKAKTPRSAAGNPTARYFQFLTPDIGYEHLKNQIITVQTLMSVARNWSEFEDLFARKFGQRALDFDEKPESPKQLPPAKPTNAFDASLKGLLSIPPPPKPEKRKKKPKPPEDEIDGEQAADLVPA